MTKVICEKTECPHNRDKICHLKIIHLIMSYGRSTNYVWEHYCEEGRG